MTVRKNFHNMPQGQSNPGFMQEKSTKRGFSKKALARNEKKNVLGPYESLESLEC
jgi:hypothetical protein